MSGLFSSNCSCEEKRIAQRRLPSYNNGCADELSFEALKDCFVEARKKGTIARRIATNPIPKVRRIDSMKAVRRVASMWETAVCNWPLQRPNKLALVG